MQTNVRSQAITITPSLAQEIIAHKFYKKQRAIRKWQVDYLSREIASDNFILGTAIHLLELNGREYLVNGQHTLHAIVQSNIPTMLTIVRSKVDSERELDTIYSNYDTGMMRTLQETLVIFELDEALQVRKNAIDWAGSAVVFINAGFESPNRDTKISRNELANTILEWGDSIKEYINIIKLADPGLLIKFRRASTMSVALATLRYAPDHDKAIEFWTQAVLDDGLGKDDPRKILHNFLMTSATTHRHSYTGATYNGREIAIITAKAWNAFYGSGATGKVSTRKPIRGTAGYSISIKGTPWE